MSTVILEDQHLVSFPSIVFHDTEIEILSLFKNEIEELPEEIERLKNLIFLNLGHNRLKSLPKTIGKLKQIHTLDLGHNSLTHLPESIGELNEMTGFLYLSN